MTSTHDTDRPTPPAKEPASALATEADLATPPTTPPDPATDTSR